MGTITRLSRRIRILVLCGVLLSMYSCGPEVVAPPTDGCALCPEKCKRIGEGQGICVTCVNNEQCRTKTSPTRVCTDQNTCVCGTEQDCGAGQVCANDRCVECAADEDCKTASAPFCVSNVCMSCKQGQTRPCKVSSPTQCDVGQQVCRASGIWGKCEFEGGTAKSCLSNEVCLDGACVCSGELVKCTGEADCIDLRTNAKHCGACGNACPTGTRCASGKCVDTCPSSTPHECANACVNTSRNPFFCGSCTTSCKIGQICQGGPCQCPPGELLCEGRCIDPTTNSNHCGACNKACPQGSLCASGACKNTCPPSTPTSCYGGCVDLKSNPHHCGKCGAACRPDQLCVDGKIVCPEDSKECGNRCVDTNIHPEHCGECGKVCKAGQLCAAGACVVTCPSATPDACYGGCVDKKTNPYHCGACGNTCPSGQSCTAGKCECPTGYVRCGKDCVDIKSARLHCGKCNNACQSNQNCAAGKCVFSCPKSTPALCFGGCVNTDTNPLHCGQCGVHCTISQECIGGECLCPAGKSTCGKSCVDHQSDPYHCGQCNNACSEVEACISSVCIYQGCGGVLTECNKKCVDTKTNAAHCGKCGEACQTGYLCVAGKCTSPCKAPEVFCGGVCVNSQTDAKHCGGCNIACQTGESCSNGVCVSSGCTIEKPVSCGGTCTNLKTDKQNCGACGNACQSGEECCNGTCADTTSSAKNCGLCGNVCLSGEDCCGGLCKDIQSDRNHCGKCSNVCTAGDNCCGGTCGKPQQGAKDVCNLKDDNCDGKIDEDCNWPSSASGTFIEGIVSPISGLLERNLQIVADDKGSVYLSGSYKTSAGFDTHTITTTNNAEFFIAKLDSTGSFQWAVTAKGTKGSIIHSMILSKKGDLYIGGSFEESIEVNGKTYKPGGKSEAFFAKVDKQTGAFKSFAHTTGSTTSQATFSSIAEDNVGTIHAAMNFTGTVRLGAQSLTSKGKADFTLCQYVAAQNTFAFIKTAGSTNSETIHRIFVDRNGIVFALGHHEGDFTFAKTTFKSKDKANGFLIKWNATTDTILWSYSFSSNTEVIANMFAVSTKGDVYVGGSYKGTMTTGGPTPFISGGDTDVFAIGLDDKGKFVWDLTIPTTGADEVTGVAIDQQGNVHVSGFYGARATYGVFTITNKGKRDAIAIKIAPSGGLADTHAAGSAGEELGLSIAVSPQNKLFVGGMFDTDFKFTQSIKFTKKGTKDLFIWKKDP